MKLFGFKYYEKRHNNLQRNKLFVSLQSEFCVNVNGKLMRIALRLMCNAFRVRGVVRI